MLALLSLAALACSTTKNGGAPSPGADAQARDAGPDASPCNVCDLAATSPGGQCASQAQTCNASTACTALATCLSECPLGDGACDERCSTASTAAAISSYDAVGNCLCATSCAAMCGASCTGAYDAGPGGGGDSGGMAGGDSGLGGGDAGGACTACVTMATSTGGACDSEVTACNQNTSCTALLACLNACQPGQTTCASTCQTTDQAGVSDFNAVNTCICGAPACMSECPSECGG